MASRSSASPATNGIASGAVSGLLMFIVIVLIDHFIFSGRETKQYGLMPALIGAAIAGVIFGAIVGVVVVMTRSLPAGVITGAVLIAILKLVDIGGAGGGFAAMAIVFGLLYGAIFGWAVASSVVKSLGSTR